MDNSKLQTFKNPIALATFLKQHSQKIVEEAYSIYRKSQSINEEIKEKNVE